MILQALVDYYERRRTLDPASVAPTGWEYREIAFFVDLGDDGSAALVDRRSTDRKRGELLLVPAAEIRSGNDAWKKPNLLWDHIGFVFGWQKRRPDGTLDPTDKPEKVAKQHEAFKERLQALAARHQESVGLQAIGRFYGAKAWADIQPPELREALRNAQGLNVTFRVRGSIDPVCHEDWVAGECAVGEPKDDGESTAPAGPCLVTGRHGAIARLHPKISYVASKPSPLVSANTNEAPAYSSYGKEQALNAPISVEAASRYALALNTLIGRSSPNKVQIADATTAIWADRQDNTEADVVAMFGDNPDAHVDAVRKRLAGATSGVRGAEDTSLRFFVLGLAPNASRIAVRFWFHDTFERLGPRILQHFDDLRIARQSDRDGPTPAMYLLLRSIAPQSKADNVPPRLAGEWLRAILEGTPYPPALLNAAVNRCRAEQAKKDERTGKPVPNVSYLRAAILKACINREYRRRHDASAGFQFIQEELDVSQTEPAYRLGRLFAVLENIQVQSARPAKLNATIRDRYYGAASSTPGAVFPTLMRLTNSHLKKLRNGMETFFEKLVGEICGSVEEPALTDFPRQLDLHAQGLFALGYYHQRQSLYAGKTADADTSTDDSTVQEN
ncbi:MAG: type I-C CRISPR-associated protein Cas8c/Csd1 [Burkholderiales bacterium]|nr:type I-C CRISPR-associated protein Cas8c/Csd1 [Burkholderiales bacterium]